ncbi:hypothetical protein [Streptomyces sp. NPDC003077]|uniref:hypothetical protein n=1 Tax=Streptomyces sp. NPDC003077 TaxID=3154443 RepID=UPI0033BBDE99
MPLTQLSPLPKYRTDLVTRRLCATAHLDDDFARTAWKELAGDALTAVGLPLGINLVALVRHARQAVLRRERRDAVLAVSVTVLVGCAALAVWALVGGHTTWAVVAAGISGGVLAFSWVVVFRAERAARAAALALGRRQEPARSLAPAVAPEVEKALEALKGANFVAYHASVESVNPFVGSGWRIKEAVWTPIDVGRPAKDDQGRPQQIRPFDATDLHQYLAVEMPRLVGLETLKARNRLYVRGLHVSHLGAGVLPDPTRRPLPVIPRQLVRSGAARPGAGAETYLCLRMLGEGGRVVVTMHLRALLLMPRLSWEVASYVLPPLASRFDAVEYLPSGPAALWWDTVRTVNEEYREAVFGAPDRLLKRSHQRHRLERELSGIRHEIRKGRMYYDYGAKDSLRERVADWDRMGYAEERDATHFFQRLQQGVLIATERFLEQHNVDTSDFESAQRQIITTQTYHINGPVNGPSQWGNNNSQGNQPVAPPGAAPPGGGPSPAPAPGT